MRCLTRKSEHAPTVSFQLFNVSHFSQIKIPIVNKAYNFWYHPVFTYLASLTSTKCPTLPLLQTLWLSFCTLNICCVPSILTLRISSLASFQISPQSAFLCKRLPDLLSYHNLNLSTSRIQKHKLNNKAHVPHFEKF